jgi:mannose-6-phosphate isomerase-like protein (cupin superfamily)
MRHFESGSAESYAVGVVDVARWEQYGLKNVMPFDAMWYTVPPGASSPRDCHPEIELSVVISGTASVEASDVVTDVAKGSCFMLGSEEAHVIHNRGDEPCMVFTTYWMPLDKEKDGEQVVVAVGEGA